MSGYHALLLKEFVNLTSKAIAVVEALVNFGLYAWAGYLWWTGAASLHVLLVGGGSVLMTLVLMYLAGRSAWQKEHGARANVEAELTLVKETAPRLRLREHNAVHIDNVTFSDRVTGQALWRADLLKIRFVNNPKRPSPTSEAKRVCATVAFSRDGQQIREVDGRWSESEQPMDRIARSQTITDLLQMDFPIGAERSLDIAFKHEADADAYIFNNDSYLARPTMKRPDFRLEPGLYEVRVRLRAVLVDEVFKFSFANLGPGKIIEIAEGGKRVVITR